VVQRLGIDTGGTFTDLVQLGSAGLTVHKLRSTPDDPSRAILQGIQALAGTTTGLDVVHGSTVATNAVLERKGARVALVTTEGFEDVLRIGRQTRPELYTFQVPAPRPIVAPDLTFGIKERLDASGQPLVPVDDKALDRLAASLRELGVDIVAVCLLHAYANPIHERQVADRLRRAGLTTSMSHDVLPEYREYERWSTTVVNAYVTPIIDRYLGALENRLRGSRLLIMQSNGG
jgi:N-methylhydantoinase A/oxoprolinase/acetone carboxylase beta subunit